MIDVIDEPLFLKKHSTRVLLLLNMIDEADTSLQGEVEEECSKYGVILVKQILKLGCPCLSHE
jgi:hypothetical protein